MHVQNAKEFCSKCLFFFWLKSKTGENFQNQNLVIYFVVGLQSWKTIEWEAGVQEAAAGGEAGGCWVEVRQQLWNESERLLACSSSAYESLMSVRPNQKTVHTPFTKLPSQCLKYLDRGGWKQREAVIWCFLLSPADCFQVRTRQRVRTEYNIQRPNSL